MKSTTSLAIALVALFLTVSANAQQVTGSGTADYVPLWTTSSTLGNSLLFQNSGKLGVGTTSPLAFFDVPVTTTSTANAQALRGSIDVTPSAAAPSAIYEGVRGQAYDSGATNSIGQLKGFVAYTESVSNQDVGVLYGLFSESQVSKSGGYAVEAYGAYANAVETAGTLTTGYGLYAQAQGAMTTGYGVYSSVVNYGSGKPATGYGVYIAPLVVSGTSYGLYQAGTNDSNYFAGPATFNSAVTFSQPINGSLNLTGSINGVLTLENNVTDPNTGYTSSNVIGGYGGNAVTNGATGATIAGGGAGSGYSNAVSADFGTVGGGAQNTASGEWSTVAGGFGNTANGETSMVAGGLGNTAGGRYSFAAGQGADARDYGSFVWCQQYGTLPCNSNGTNSFTVSVSGPIYFYYGGGSCYLSTSSASWTCSSDRNLKDDIESIDSRSVLGRVAQMPISQWRMKADTGGHKHIGPMAQDFYAAFGLGDSDKYIAQGDAQGVALASIQGLYQLLKEKDEQIQALRDELHALESQLKPAQR